MRCTTCRDQLHNWFDTQGSAAMPVEVSEHVRDCSDCRSFIKSWNSVELGLQSVREHGPTPSADFAVALQARLSREKSRRWIRIPFPSIQPFAAKRLAFAALAVFLIAVAAKYSSSIRSYFIPHGQPVATNNQPDPRTLEVKPPISPSLPFAKGQ